MTSAVEDEAEIAAITEQVTAFAPLSRDEIATLLDAARGPAASAARLRLVEHHLGVALRGAVAHRNEGLPVGDLYQEGTLALTVAVAEYSERGGSAPGLAAYLEKVVATHLEVAIAAHVAAQAEDLRLARAAETLQISEVRLRHEFGREPTDAELATALEWPLVDVETVRAMVRAAHRRWDEEIVSFLDDADE